MIHYLNIKLSVNDQYFQAEERGNRYKQIYLEYLWVILIIFKSAYYLFMYVGFNRHFLITLKQAVLKRFRSFTKLLAAWWRFAPECFSLLDSRPPVWLPNPLTRRRVSSRKHALRWESGRPQTEKRSRSFWRISTDFFLLLLQGHAAGRWNIVLLNRHLQGNHGNQLI